MLASASVIAVALVALGVGAPAASASEPDVLLSRNGTDFSTNLPGGLFDELGLLVPGETISAGLWVRNPTDQTVNMRVSARDISIPSSAYADGVDLTVWNSAAGVTRESSLAQVAQCDVLVQSHAIAAGATERLLFTFSMDDLDGSLGQNEAADVSIAVAMRDHEAGAFSDSACDDDATVISSRGTKSPGRAGFGGRIAYTGGELPVPLIATAALLTGGGVFLIGGTRRRAAREGSVVETTDRRPVP